MGLGHTRIARFDVRYENIKFIQGSGNYNALSCIIHELHMYDYFNFIFITKNPHKTIYRKPFLI